MSTNKVNGLAPGMSLAPTSQVTSDLMPLSANQQSLVSNPASLGLTANTLNTLNALNNPQATLNTLNANFGATLNTTPQTLNTLNTIPSAPSHTISPMNPAGGFSAWGQPAGSGGSPATTFLPSSQMPTMVSLPQTLCFSSQAPLHSMSGTNPGSLGMTLGFPVMSGTSLADCNTLPIVSTSVLNSSGLLPLNTGTYSLQSLPLGQNQTISIPHNLGSSLQQNTSSLPQIMSLPQTMVSLPQNMTSLPQNISIPILSFSSSSLGSAGTQFLTTSIPGLSSIFVGGQQSLLLGGQGASTPDVLMGGQGSSPAPGSQLSTGFPPQSLSLPVSLPTLPIHTGPVLTELPDDPHQSNKLDALPAQVTAALSTAPLPEDPLAAEPGQVETVTEVDQPSNAIVILPVESVTSQPVPEPMECDELKAEEAQTSTVSITRPAVSEMDYSHSAPPSQSEVSSTQADLVTCAGQATGEGGDASSTLRQKGDKLEAGGTTDSSAIKHETKDAEMTCLYIMSSPIKEETNEDQVDGEDNHIRKHNPVAQGTPFHKDGGTGDDHTHKPEVEGTTFHRVAGAGDEHAHKNSPVAQGTTFHRDGGDENTHSPSSAFHKKKPAFGLLAGMIKKEQRERDEDDDDDSEELPLPDSTPGGSEDSLDSCQSTSQSTRQRQSPSMASLRLTRADTTTTVSSTATIAHAKMEEGEGGDDGDDQEFVWEDYLSFTNTTAVPPTAFKHVECSLESSFEKGMRVEVANKENPGTYWVAAIVMNSGPLLRLRWEGFSEADPSGVFWSQSGCDVHPIGWCAEHGKTLEPPEGVKDKHEDWSTILAETLKTVPHAPSYLLDSTTGTSPFEQVKQGMRLELQSFLRPNEVWLVRITENVGGRLYLRVEGLDSGKADFWAFYLAHFLHPIGWAASMGYSYKPPKALTDQGLSESEIKHILDSALEETKTQTLPSDIFKDQVTVTKHKFTKGMKLEAVNPCSRSHICPATVVEVIDDYYFIVEMDDLTSLEPERRNRYPCYRKSPFIFPVQWTVYKGIKLTAPPGWPKPDFSWSEYLAHCSAVAAPDNLFDLADEEHEFERGMKLECVNPDKPNQICVATITKIVAHLLWVHLDSSPRLVASHVEHAGSHNLFPVGWCESNRYPLQPPYRAGFQGAGLSRRVAIVQPEQSDGRGGDDGSRNGNSPTIYFNHKCFSGPLLSKSGLSQLPRSVGPGPVHLVMKEVLSLLISVAYKPSKVLRELQQEGSPNPAMTPQILKAKYQGKSYKAVVEVCRSVVQLENFCRDVCIKLECCPYLISPHFIGGSCPENCWRLTKTKYTHYYGKKKRKIGRPPGGHSNLEDGSKKPAKRRKRKRIGMMPRRPPPPGEEESTAAGGGEGMPADSSTGASTSASAFHHPHRADVRPHSHSTATAISVASKRLKRKYTHHIPPPSEIRTRGAKVKFERRTHKKILLSPPPIGGQGLRSKTLQTHKPFSHARSSSPETPARLPPANRPQTLTGLYTRATYRAPSTPSPSTSLSSVSNGPTFTLPPPSSPLALDRNPLTWSVEETVEFIKTTDCAHVAKLFRDQEIDGQALLLLTLPSVQEHLNMKLGPALKLCDAIQKVKCAFYTRYDPARPQSHR